MAYYYHKNGKITLALLEKDNVNDLIQIENGCEEFYISGKIQNIDLLKVENGNIVEDEEAILQSKKEEVRNMRDFKLQTEVDPIVGNALRWADLTAIQQQELAVYRQELLDVPQQPGFPNDVVWPTKPE